MQRHAPPARLAVDPRTPTDVFPYAFPASLSALEGTQKGMVADSRISYLPSPCALQSAQPITNFIKTEMMMNPPTGTRLYAPDLDAIRASPRRLPVRPQLRRHFYPQSSEAPRPTACPARREGFSAARLLSHSTPQRSAARSTSTMTPPINPLEPISKTRQAPNAPTLRISPAHNHDNAFPTVLAHETHR